MQIKRIAIIFVAVITVMLLVGCAEEPAGGNNEERQLIQTYGEAEVSAEPDLVRISVEVETHSSYAEEAVEENAELANRVREALIDFGLDEDEVRTGSYRLQSRRERPPEVEEPDRPQPDEMEEAEEAEEVEEQIYYRDTNEIRVTSSELEHAGEIIDTAVEAGANKVNYINFELEDPQELKMEALDKATKQAERKAEVIAESAGESIVGLYSIKEERADYTPHRAEIEMAEEAAAMGDAPTPVEPDEVDVRAAVTAEYAF